VVVVVVADFVVAAAVAADFMAVAALTVVADTGNSHE
jgi:hypothetical protein